MSGSSVLFLALISIVCSSPVVIYGSKVRSDVQDASDLMSSSSRVAVVFSRPFDAAWHFFADVEKSSLKFPSDAFVLRHNVVNDGASFAHVLARKLSAQVLFEEQFSCSSKLAQPKAVVFVPLDRGTSQITMERVEKCVKESGQEATFFFVAEVAESTVESNLETLSERNVEERQTANTNSSDPNPPSSSSFSYFPTYVWAWVIVMLVMIGFVISSINSLSGVQVPPRLLSAEQAASKKNK